MLVFGLALCFSIPFIVAMDLGKYQSRYWPSVTGKVSNLELKYFNPYKNSGSLSFNYQYTVDLISYKHAHSESTGRYGSVTGRWLEYKEGGDVEVFYDPKNSEKTLLEYQKNESIFWLVLPNLFLHLVSVGTVKITTDNLYNQKIT